ncbi:LysR family transcriptional regulator [Antarctobacter jejuensis]|uniref:LysR family transcriptional regulator n=1 Tax=Antarctobacter jejuensis TaxID=1439938 RepID=UPI003FD406F1
MNETPFSLDDLAVLVEVARCGSLSEASRQSDIPLPTLSRRMTRLEQQCGRALFLRGKAGYTLTTEGRALVERVAGLNAIRRKADLWRDTAVGPVPVRITAGFWTSRFLAQRLSPEGAPLWRPAFLPSNANLDLAHREADIGIRNRAPDSSRLARQRLRRIGFAIYARGPEITGFVSLPTGIPAPPSQRWLHENHEGEITTTASDPRLCLDLALGGFGRVVLPTFAGDAEPGLIRLSDPIPELAHEEWLVSHHEARHDPPIRAALNTIAEALTEADG